MRNSRSQTKPSTRLSVSSTASIKKSVTTTTNTKPKPRATQKSLSNKDSKITTTSSKVSTTKNLSSSKTSTIKASPTSTKASPTSTKTSPTSTTKTSPKDTKSSRNLNSSSLSSSSTTTKIKSTTVKKKLKEKQEKQENVETDSPICSEIDSVMCELEKFRMSLHELSKVQEKQTENFSPSKNSGTLQDEIMMQAVQNQLSVVRQHITSIMDNYESDENLLTVIMTYNEEVNIALQEAIREVPKLYQTSSKSPPSPSSSSSSLSQFSSPLSEFNSTNDPQQIIEAQQIQIQFLERANFNNVFQLINDIEKCQINLDKFIEINHELGINLDLIESKNLLRKYDIKIDLDKLYEKDENYSKILLSKMLQRLLIETVLEHSDIYFTGSLENFKSQNLTITNSMLITNDQYNRQTTKINPEIYGVLGSNGFDGFEHPFIEFVGEKLIDIIERFFDIRNSNYVQNRQKFVNLANELVHDIINVFYFRIQAQEPSAQYQWMEYGKEIDLEVMSIINYEKESDAVGICSFPVIGKGLNDKDNLQIYTKAKVLPLIRLDLEIK